ncbi:MAG: hypothetical protein AB7J13_11685 [Pyrinomonadaceae bacterium]
MWNLDGNPIVGYRFKDAAIVYISVDQIDADGLCRWLEKSQNNQWDYKDLMKQMGRLDRLAGVSTAVRNSPAFDRLIDNQ